MLADILIEGRVEFKLEIRVIRIRVLEWQKRNCSRKLVYENNSIDEARSQYVSAKSKDPMTYYLKKERRPNQLTQGLMKNKNGNSQSWFLQMDVHSWTRDMGLKSFLTHTVSHLLEPTTLPYWVQQHYESQCSFLHFQEIPKTVALPSTYEITTGSTCSY